jgi:hypothetical protein
MYISALFKRLSFCLRGIHYDIVNYLFGAAVLHRLVSASVSERR